MTIRLHTNTKNIAIIHWTVIVSWGCSDVPLVLLSVEIFWCMSPLLFIRSLSSTRMIFGILGSTYPDILGTVVLSSIDIELIRGETVVPFGYRMDGVNVT